MWRRSWFMAILSMLVATQTSLVFAADGSSQGAKALFYTETGTTVDPKTDDRGPNSHRLQRIRQEKTVALERSIGPGPVRAGQRRRENLGWASPTGSNGSDLGRRRPVLRTHRALSSEVEIEFGSM
jgi:hypothetical protein